MVLKISFRLTEDDTIQAISCSVTSKNTKTGLITKKEKNTLSKRN